MKKVMLVCLVLALPLVLAGCGGESKAPATPPATEAPAPVTPAPAKVEETKAAVPETKAAEAAAPAAAEKKAEAPKAETK